MCKAKARAFLDIGEGSCVQNGRIIVFFPIEGRAKVSKELELSNNVPGMLTLSFLTKVNENGSNCFNLTLDFTV